MSEKGKCFIIQPLTDKYKKRCEEAYKPAIEKVGLTPYRVDEDYDAKKLKIQMIKEEIEKSVVCLAEISEDSPNVWYELGFADGHDVPVVLICELDKRKGLPFDVNQRDTCFYDTGSPSGWVKLQEEITGRLNITLVVERSAKKEKGSVTKNINRDESEFGETALFILGFLYFNPENNSDGGVSRLIKEMKMLEFSQEAQDVAFRKLEFEKMIDIDVVFEHEEPHISLTKKGHTWCSNNEKRMEFYCSLIRNFEP